MSQRRVIIYMPDSLVEALNQVTARSPQSRSEIICEAIERYLEQGGEPETPARPGRETEDTLSLRVAELIESGLLKPEDIARGLSAPDSPKSKLWIN